MCVICCLGDDSRPGVDSTSGMIISTIIFSSSQYLYIISMTYLYIISMTPEKAVTAAEFGTR